MSLIQEALKRKTEEDEQTTRPHVMTPEERAVLSVLEADEPEETKKSPNIPIIILTVLVIIGFFAALTGLAVYLMKGSVLKPSATASSSTEKVTITQEPLTTAPASAEPTESIANIAQSAPVVAEKAKEIPVVEEPVINEKEWPKLVLSGIAASGNERIAILNGKMLTAERSIDGVIIREILSTEIVVEYHGVRRVLHVDE